MNQSIHRNFIIVLTFLTFFVGCVQRVEFELPEPSTVLVVEGMITNNSSTYRVLLSQGQDLESIEVIRIPVENAVVILFDDAGNGENFVEIESGVYETSGLIVGQIGRSYYITIEVDGNIYESTPEILKPVGFVEEIRFEFEDRMSTSDEVVDQEIDVFNIFVDADAGSNDPETYVRWKMTGTFGVETNPEEDFFWIQGQGVNQVKFPDPPPCSGYEIGQSIGPPRPVQVGDCTCCVCWVQQHEKIPQLSDTKLVIEGRFRNVRIGEVPITRTTFEDRYLVTVEQMSLSRAAFDFFRLIREQKESASSIFQPSFGDIGGNVYPVGHNKPVVGLFWATSISTRSEFIYRADVPYLLPEKNLVPKDCREAFDFSTTEMHPQW